LQWFLADAGPAEAFPHCYTDDCIIDLGRIASPNVDTIVRGRAQVYERYVESDHRKWEGRSQHLSAGPQAICIDNDEARAITYAVTTLLVDGTPKTVVIGFNFWKLKRIAGHWRISHRTARRLGDGDVIELFKPIVGQVIEEL
jgi:hypothetical protein